MMTFLLRKLDTRMTAPHRKALEDVEDSSKEVSKTAVLLMVLPRGVAEEQLGVRHVMGVARCAAKADDLVTSVRRRQKSSASAPGLSLVIFR